MRIEGWLRSQWLLLTRVFPTPTGYVTKPRVAALGYPVNSATIDINPNGVASPHGLGDSFVQQLGKDRLDFEIMKTMTQPRCGWEMMVRLFPR